PAQNPGYPVPAGQQPGYPGQQPGYPGQQPGYPGQQPGHPGQQPGYPGQQPGYPGQQPGFAPPPQQGYPTGPQAPGVNPPNGPPQGGYPQPAGGVPQNGQPMQPPSGGEVVSYDDDVPDENPNEEEPVPSAPLLENMDNIQGYNNMSFNNATVPPPPAYDEVTQDNPPDRGEIKTLPVISESEARDALLGFVAQNCCYGKGAAQSMVVRDRESTSAFHYTLETFTEGRHTAWAYEGFRGQPVDGPQNGIPPAPWDIPAAPNQLFLNGKVAVEVPHTASVKVCHTCLGACKVRCHRCYGFGRVRCSSCRGSGSKSHMRNGEHVTSRCTFCHGHGRRRCNFCHGVGMVNCKTCSACGQLKCFIQLTVTWINHVEDYVEEKTALPNELIKSVTGKTVLEEQYPLVWPVTNFPDPAINQASNTIVQKHRTAFASERILHQRQKVRLVPVTEVSSQYKSTDFKFFVYGDESKVYAPEYPQQCCCGCTIL
ncbi:hypothetical protein CAPTEDRAFT_73168, partial [Capitella teleta]